MLNNAKAEGKESIVRVCCYSPRAPSINPDDRRLKRITREQVQNPEQKNMTLQSEKLDLITGL